MDLLNLRHLVFKFRFFGFGNIPEVCRKVGSLSNKGIFMSLRVGLMGFGRTGSLVAKEILSDSDLKLEWVCRKSKVSNLAYASHTLGLKETSGPFVCLDNFNIQFLQKNPVDVVIDFSTNSGCHSYEMLAANGAKIVTAISKYDENELKIIKQASTKSAILYSPNITLGINWLMIASQILKQIIPQADIEVVEEHFRDKKEVSGTALRLANQLGLDNLRHVNSIRVGGVVGKHEVIFGLPNQTIRLTHETINRSAFGAGALYAGKWLVNKDPGLYSMEHVFHEKFLKKIRDMEL